MSDCGCDLEAKNREQQKALLWLLAINAFMFLAEFGAGLLSQSTALSICSPMRPCIRSDFTRLARPRSTRPVPHPSVVFSKSCWRRSSSARS